jgi:hypothetical protein
MEKQTEQTQLPLQLDFVDKVKNAMLGWTSRSKLRLHTIECVVPFVLTDKSLFVYLFYDTDKTKIDYENNGINEEVKSKYSHFLTELNYPTDYLKEVSFVIDSDENVRKKYAGSYFYRLR